MRTGLFTERARVRFLHRCDQRKADRPVQHDVPGRRERLPEPLDEPGRHERRRSTGERERDAVGEAHRGDARAQRKDLDDHRALKAERHAERHGQQNLAERELPRRPIQHEPQRRSRRATIVATVRMSISLRRPDAIGEPAAERLREQHEERGSACWREETRPPRRRAAAAPFDGVGEREVVGGVRHRDDAERLHASAASRRRATEGAAAAFAAACSPCSVSCMPRRRSQPAKQNSTLPMKGMRQPQAATCSGVEQRVDEPRRRRAENEAERDAGGRRSC